MSSSDNDPKKAEEMSLSELLGSSEAASVPQAAGGDAESEDDKSGLINLSQMANMMSSPVPTQPQEPSQQAYSTAPVNQMTGSAGYAASAPVANVAPVAQPQQTAAGFPSIDPATMSAYADVAMPAKKKPVAVIAIVAIALIAGGVGAYVALSGSDGSDKPAAVNELPQDIASVQSSEASGTPAPAEGVAAGDNAAASNAAEQAEQAEQADDAVVEGEGEGDEEYEITEEEVDDGKGGKKRRKVRRVKKSTASTRATTSKMVAKAESADPAPAKAKSTETSKKSSTTTSALDSLLAGGGGSSAKDSGGLPQQPSRDQVQKAMAPVVRKARNSCSGSGSGKVSVRIIVGSNGVVRDAIPLGEHSADSLGRCVATFARKTARLPAFKAPTFTFTYPFTI